MQELESENRRLRAHLDLVRRELLKIIGDDPDKPLTSQRSVHLMQAVGRLISEHESQRQDERDIRAKAIRDVRTMVASQAIIYTDPNDDKALAERIVSRIVKVLDGMM